MRIVIEYFRSGFYLLYRLLTIIGHPELYAEGLAFFTTAMLPWLNVLTIVFYLKRKYSINLIEGNGLLVVFLVYIFGAFIYFFATDQHKESMDYYQANPVSKRRKYIFFSYSVLSILFYAIL